MYCFNRYLSITSIYDTFFKEKYHKTTLTMSKSSDDEDYIDDEPKEKVDQLEQNPDANIKENKRQKTRKEYNSLYYKKLKVKIDKEDSDATKIYRERLNRRNQVRRNMSTTKLIRMKQLQSKGSSLTEEQSGELDAILRGRKLNAERMKKYRQRKKSPSDPDLNLKKSIETKTTHPSVSEVVEIPPNPFISHSTSYEKINTKTNQSSTKESNNVASKITIDNRSVSQEQNSFEESSDESFYSTESKLKQQVSKPKSRTRAIPSDVWNEAGIESTDPFVSKDERKIIVNKRREDCRFDEFAKMNYYEQFEHTINTGGEFNINGTDYEMILNVLGEPPSNDNIITKHATIQSKVQINKSTKNKMSELWICTICQNDENTLSNIPGGTYLINFTCCEPTFYCSNCVSNLYLQSPAICPLCRASLYR